jgi:hypothetical protein
LVPSRPGKLHFVGKVAWPQNGALERRKEALLGERGHVQSVRDAVVADVLDECFFEAGVVMPIIQGTGSGEKINITFAVYIF